MARARLSNSGSGGLKLDGGTTTLAYILLVSRATSRKWVQPKVLERSESGKERGRSGGGGREP